MFCFGQMAYLKCNHSRKDIIVLLGPSGCGKTTFGQIMVNKSQSGSEPRMFLSTGDKLREGNHIAAYRESNMTAVKEFCYELISKTFTNFTASKSAMLILDCVKDFTDAEYVATQANKHGLKITRALLFDIDETELEKSWQKRADITDMLRMHGSVHKYLYQWRKRSNDLINYYMNLKLLSKKPSASYYYWYCDYITNIPLDDYPICFPPNNQQFMLLDSNQIKNVFMRLYSVLNVSQFEFSLPVSLVHSYRDVKWVANPARYYVTTKADGVRCLLLKISDGAYLITRNNEIYPCHIADDRLVENSVLDGELLPSASMSDINPKIGVGLSLKTSVFLVFDVLAVSGEVLWKWPLRIRLESLSKLPIRKDIVTVMNQASTDGQTPANYESDLANEKLTIHCAIKGHRESTPEDILICLNTKFPYPCDGLVFTPDKAYVFGRDPLMFKWQSEDDVHCDIRLDDISEVLECRWNPETRSWMPLFMRPDKVVPNSYKTINHLEKICQRPYTKEFLAFNLAQVGIFNKDAAKSKCDQQDCGHPSKSFSFDELFSNVNELVQFGQVGKTVDVSTSLEIFSYHASNSLRNPMMVRLSRGLVLHPPSKTVVTRPFVRFYEDVSDRDPDEIVEATIKFDGSLGIAFLWKGEVMVTTRRRMDSQQAIWAKQWIKDHCNLTEFQAGYTYLFEIISQNNTVVVNYLFEGLVLLAITNENGYELPYEEMLHCARTIRFFMVTPRITGSYSEVLWYCGRIKPSEETATPNSPPFTSGALPVNEKQQEGWVLKFNDGSRQKIVYRWWKDASRLGYLVHPQVVWLLLKHDKIKEVFENAPHHFQAEIRRMVQAIGRSFDETLQLTEKRLRKPGLCEPDQWWDSKVDYADDLEINEELTLPNEDSEESDGRLRQLLNQLAPYRHPRTQFANRKPLLVYEELKEMSVNEEMMEIKPVNRSPFFHHSKPNFLRLPILNYICPTYPTLKGYEPSDNFKQTWCKGWKQISMINEWQVMQTVLQTNDELIPFLRLPVEVIVMILTFLDHASLTALAKVCVYLRQIVKSCKTNRLFEKAKKPRRISDYDEEPWKRYRYISSYEPDDWTSHGIYGSW